MTGDYPAALRAMADNLERDLAEREATPPSVGEGGEFVTGPGEPTSRRTFRATATPPPAPAQDEAAVEALARVLAPMLIRLDIDPDNCFTGDLETARAFADDLLRQFDRGAVPGYGPTGASDGAGKVVTPERIWQAWHGADDEPWGGCADRGAVERVLDLLRGTR